MKLEKHIEDLIGLLKDIRKEPSPAVISFAFSAAALHMFSIAFHDELDPGVTIKHGDFRSNKGIEKLKNLIREFSKKNDLFSMWKDMENKRNDLCYGYPANKDIKEYSDRFYKIKNILEDISDFKFEIGFLEDHLRKMKADKDE